jgi:DNA-binding protein YbaB
MFGDMKEKQAAMQKKLAEIQLISEAAEGKIKIMANAARQINDISIDPTLLSGNKEELEDYLTIAMNRMMLQIATIEQEESQKLIQEMLPPGMGGLGSLFGL